MADDSTASSFSTARPPEAGALLRYIEDMLLELAQLSAGVGEPALAASLAIAAIQAGSVAERRELG